MSNQPPHQYEHTSPNLPPGTEEFNSTVYGKLQMVLGRAQWIQDSYPHWQELFFKVLLWGQKGIGSAPLLYQSIGNKLEYNILVPLPRFEVYLKDMGSLRLWLVDAKGKIYGFVLVNIVKHLTRDLQLDISNLSGQYPIYRYLPEQNDSIEYKMGYIHIALWCGFDKFKQLQNQFTQGTLKQQPPSNTTVATRSPERQKRDESVQVKSPSKDQAVQHPAVNYLFPSAKEEWLTKAPKAKLLNQMFMNSNPFEEKPKENSNKPLEERQYSAATYVQPEQQVVKPHLDQPIKKEDLVVQNKENLVVHNENLVVPSQKEAQLVQPQKNCCCPEHPHPCYFVMQPLPTEKQQSIPRWPSPPVRHTKPGSGHYNYTPTGYRFMKAPISQERVPPKRSPVKRISPPVIEKSVQTYRVEAEALHPPAKHKEEALNSPSSQVFVIDHNNVLLQVDIIEFIPINIKTSKRLEELNSQNIYVEVVLESHKTQNEKQERPQRVFIQQQEQHHMKIERVVNFPVNVSSKPIVTLKIAMSCLRIPLNEPTNELHSMELGHGSFEMKDMFENPRDEYLVPIIPSKVVAHSKLGDLKLRIKVHRLPLSPIPALRATFQESINPNSFRLQEFQGLKMPT